MKKHIRKSQSANKIKEDPESHQIISQKLNNDLYDNFSKHLDTLIDIKSISFFQQAQCGYCEGQKSNKLWVNSGFICKQMSLKCYQMLLDRGWRRSGIYFYQPATKESCCQAYSIRLNINKFKRRKFQEKAIKKIKHIKLIQGLNSIDEESLEEESVYSKKQLEKFLQNYDFPPKWQEGIQIDTTSKYISIKSISVPISEVFQQEIQQIVEMKIKQIDYKELNTSIFGEYKQEYHKQLMDLIQQANKESSAFEAHVTKGHCSYESLLKNKNAQSYHPFAFNIFSIFYSRLRSTHKNLPYFRGNESWIKYLYKLFSDQNIWISFSGSVFITNDICDKYKQFKLVIFKFLSENQSQFQQTQQTQQQQQQQLRILKQPTQNPIVLKWVKAGFEEDSFNLYKLYQKEIHHKNNISEQSYLNFLCNNSLQPEKIQPMFSEAEELICGCFHMKYYLQNVLIAVGVVDVMPTSLSQVYFFYHPRYRKFSLGVVGIMNEIQFIQRMQLNGFPLFQYYYLGYYIQDSKKMSYKADYQQSELLCPDTYNWVKLDDKLKEKIQQNQNLSEAQEQKIDKDISYVRIQRNDKTVKIVDLNPKQIGYFSNILKQLLELVGPAVMKEMIFY